MFVYAYVISIPPNEKGRESIAGIAYCVNNGPSMICVGKTDDDDVEGERVAIHAFFAGIAVDACSNNDIDVEIIGNFDLIRKRAAVIKVKEPFPEEAVLRAASDKNLHGNILFQRRLDAQMVTLWRDTMRRHELIDQACVQARRMRDFHQARI